MYMLLSLTLPLLVLSHPINQSFLPLDCQDIFNNGSVHSGVYNIYPGGSKSPLQVYCDMGCAENNSHQEEKWTVIQRRMDGTVNFYRPWDAYKHGFGDRNGEYWLGLENIFQITWREKHELRVDLEDFEQGKVYCRYSSFYIDSELENYKLHISGYIDGGAGDSLTYHNGKQFATFDKDINNCAKTYEGGFWFDGCHHTNPNGVYKWGRGVAAYTGVHWHHWKGDYYSLKSIVMKMRRVFLPETKQ
ncbi:microfibril-associated glycoprotein 4-like [Pangasianodon hypophthalmus]|uniref:microfibril-associated glycoprotein 4-like n=1 Tax=Pangasianodon hypophthalmus TaxID=310915 RepID=UPI000EFF6DA3|nr:microfibril-associated glycoprotein 4-like [Pangasianodon hypophthalmus]